MLCLTTAGKTPSLIGFPKKDERVFAENAEGLSLRQSHKTISHLKTLFGVKFEDDQFNAFKVSYLRDRKLIDR